MSKKDAQRALQNRARDLLQLPGVNLVYTATKITGGKDTGKHAVVVAVTKKHPPQNLAALGLIAVPPTLSDNVPTDVVEGGPFTVSPDYKSLATPIDDPKDHQKKFRPTVPGGVSAIVCGSSACTTTCWVWANHRPDGSAGPMLLHNWHCSYLNACPEMLTLQPSPYDGGFPTDAISKVTAGNIDNPTTDSAVDVPLDDGYAAMEIYGLGKYLGYTTPNIGDQLEKSGRTTGLTKGSCTATDGVANVQYPDKVRTKSDLIVTTDMLAGGDSSSPLRIIVNGQPTPALAGQGFAGGGGVSLFIKIQNILNDPAISPFQLDFNHQFGGSTPSLTLTFSPSTITNDGSTQATWKLSNVTVGDAIVVGIAQPDGTPITEFYNDTAPSTIITGTGSYQGPLIGPAYAQAGDLTTHAVSNKIPVTIIKPSTCPMGNGAAKVLSLLPILLGRQGRFYYLNPSER